MRVLLLLLLALLPALVPAETVTMPLMGGGVFFAGRPVNCSDTCTKPENAHAETLSTRCLTLLVHRGRHKAAVLLAAQAIFDTLRACGCDFEPLWGGFPQREEDEWLYSRLPLVWFDPKTCNTWTFTPPPPPEPTCSVYDTPPKKEDDKSLPNVDYGELAAVTFVLSMACAIFLVVASCAGW